MLSLGRPGCLIFAGLRGELLILMTFSYEVEGGWLPVLDEYHLPPLTGDMLVEVVRRKKDYGWQLRWLGLERA